MYKIDGPFYAQLPDAAAEARRLAAIGFDGVYTLEGNSDPFLPLVLASEHAPQLDISTGIAVAFPRNPAHLAYQAWDLHKFSKGRFALGLGSQIKTHIERRFSCEFDPPLGRMREHVEAIKAFFDCWQHGSKLDYRGKYRQHTLMTPMFNAGPNPYGIPPVWLGALGPKMTELAGEVADGWIVHPFNNAAFLQDVARPALARGLQKNAAADDFCVSLTAIIVTGDSPASINAARESVRGLLGFYGSTPAYRAPMDAIDKGHLQPVLNDISKQGQWERMADYIDDEFLDAFAIVGQPEEIAGKIYRRYGDMAQRISIYAPYAAPDAVWQQVIAGIKALG
ncbi:MAG TPA: TIGR03617 family F420-dependent LLM class oxidoreductase [Pseudomonadales bacterium]